MNRAGFRATAANVSGALAAAAIAVIFSLLLLLHDPLVFWNDDFELSILPVCADVARAWQHGEFPLLSPYSWVCGNLAGEFQYGVFSVFVNAAIVLIWKFPLFFSQQAASLSIAHLAVLSAGGFILGRDRNVSIAHSVLVGIIAALNGWIICWGATDWFGALGAFAWLPWCWWAAERAFDPRRSHWRFLWPAPFVYLLITGGFPYTVLMLALVLGWVILRSFLHRRTAGTPLTLRHNGWLGGFFSILSTCAGPVLGIALGIGLAAPAWLALIDYVQGSARVAQNSSAHWQWLVPWQSWPGLVLPSWTVNWSDFSSRNLSHTGTELACGLLPVAALTCGAIRHPRQLWRRIGWELPFLTIVGALAMLPMAGVFRWSFRWLPLFHLLLALCAAEALRVISEGGAATRRPTTRRVSALCCPSIVALALVILTVLAAELFGTGGKYLFPLGWILATTALVWIGLEVWLPLSLREWSSPVIAIAALLSTYLCIPPNCGVPKYNFAQSLLRPQPLDRQRLYLSVYPPPEEAYRVERRRGPIAQTVRPGSTSMWAGIRLINGYSPIRAAGVAREFASGIHGEIDQNMAEWLLWSEAHVDGLLERLGVDGIIVAREFDFGPLPANEWQLVVANDEARVFHRREQPLATVRSVDWDGKHVLARVNNIAECRNHVSAAIDVPAGDEPALIAFSRPYFGGYRATIEGRDVPVTAIRNLMPLVEVPAATRGTLVLKYRPAWLLVGGAVAIFSAVIWLGCAGMALAQIRSR